MGYPILPIRIATSKKSKLCWFINWAWKIDSECPFFTGLAEGNLFSLECPTCFCCPFLSVPADFNKKVWNCWKRFSLHTDLHS